MVHKPQSSIHDVRYRALIARLRAVREDAGLTQDEIAAAIGFTQSQYSKVERSERRIDVLEFVRIVEAAKADPVGLLRDFLDQDGKERTKATGRRR